MQGLAGSQEEGKAGAAALCCPDYPGQREGSHGHQGVELVEAVYEGVCVCVCVCGSVVVYICTCICVCRFYMYIQNAVCTIIIIVGFESARMFCGAIRPWSPSTHHLVGCYTGRLGCYKWCFI